MPNITVNDLNMYYEIHGEGEPLVMIASAGGELSVMGFDDRKPARYRWIVFDNRGAGRTDKPDMPYTVEMLAEDTIGLLDAVGIKRAHFLGMSLGSYVALTIAAKYPERVNGLVLASSAARCAANDSPQIEFVYEQLRKQLQQPGFLEMTSRYPPTVQSILRQMDAVQAFDGRDLLAKVKAPTLIVNGTKDLTIPVSYARELVDGIKGSKLVLVDGDHFAAMSGPAFLPPMYGFLAEVDEKLSAKAVE